MLLSILTGEAHFTEVFGLLLILALLFSRERSVANRLLAAGILCGLFQHCLLLLRSTGAIFAHPFLIGVAFPFGLLEVSLVYLYFEALTTPNFCLSRRHLWHLVPFLFGSAWLLSIRTWGGEAFFRPGPTLDTERFARLTIKTLITVPYLFAAWRLVGDFTRRTKEHVSNLTALHLKWLRLLLFISSTLFLINCLDVLTGPSVPVWKILPVALLFSLMALALFSLIVSPIFAAQIKLEVPENSDVESEGILSETGGSKLGPDELEKLVKCLRLWFEKESPHLDPDLRLSDLAAAIQVKPYRASEVLNRGMNTTFYDLVNHHRIRTAESILVDPKKSHLNLLGVAMESGFKSKSVFNEVFKKVNHSTPSAYRDRLLTSSAESKA